MITMQSNVVKFSNHMEKEELKNALQFLTQQSINISGLITDQHTQITQNLCARH